MKLRPVLPSASVVFAASLALWAGSASAQHTAYVFNTGDAALPQELINAITAHGGAGTQIVEFKPGTTATLNGAQVHDMGNLTLPRYDLVIGLSHAPNPEARHYIVAGNLELSPSQSIWGWGSSLLKLEVLGDAWFLPSSRVSVGAVGRLGGAGGGSGGIAVNHPYLNLVYSTNGPGRASGGGAPPLPAKGEDGQTGNTPSAYTTQINGLFVPAADYISSVSGGDGTVGQGDAFFVQQVLSACRGGQASVWNGSEPGGGGGGTGGDPGFSGSFASNGFNGGRGIDGGGGVNGMSGANGSLSTLAGTATHLRGGSGGGAGATGGTGQIGRRGGGGGGGGASGTDTIVNTTVRRGGNGGRGGMPGAGGAGGKGGDGGGGGGGLQLIVRGKFINTATFIAAGAAGGSGSAGSTGANGAAGEGGVQGEQSIFLDGGNGGDGGTGGKGGNGGTGGTGASGSGGNIQIAAGEYQQMPGASFNTAGGPGAPAGLVQIHSFNGTTQNAPFGAFAYGANPFRSYTQTSFVGPQSASSDTAFTPYIPVEGGPATSGLLRDFTSSSALATILQPPAAAVGAIVRLPTSTYFSNFAGYDLVLMTPMKPGVPVRAPKICMINSFDAANAAAPIGTPAWVPNGPQPAMYETGDASNPIFVPGAAGPRGGDLAYDKGFATLVDKGKMFNITAQSTIYTLPRTFRGSPLAGNPANPNRYSGSVLYIMDRGLMETTITSTNGFSTDPDLIVSSAEGGENRSASVLLRRGGTAKFRFLSKNIGNPWSEASGSYRITYYDPTGTRVTEDQNYTSIPRDGAAIDKVVSSFTGGIGSNGTAEIATLSLTPQYDFDTPLPSHFTLSGSLVGPVPEFTGLEPSGGLLFSTTTVQGVSRTIQLKNVATLIPSTWADIIAAHPELAELLVIQTTITGPNASAFSRSAPPGAIQRGGIADIGVEFHPPGAGNYSATLRIVTDHNANPGQPGTVFEIPLTGFADTYAAWAQSLPAGQRGENDDANGNGISNLVEYGLRHPMGAAPMPWLVKTVLPGGQPGTRMEFDLPGVERPDIRWSVSGSPDLVNWQVVARRSTAGAWTLTNPADTATEALLGGARRAGITRPLNTARHFLRLNAEAAVNGSNAYTNDFAAGARATLLGTAVVDNGSLRLTDAVGGQWGSAILDGVEAWPGQTGFTASFQLTVSPGSSGAVADGMSFSAGNLGTAAWGENGPNTARNLTFSFDTYENGQGQIQARGIRIMANGALVSYSPAAIPTDGTPAFIFVMYTPAGGATLYNGNTAIFSNVAVPGFTLQPGDNFGFGGRTGGLNEVNRVDNVTVGPR